MEFDKKLLLMCCGVSRSCLLIQVSKNSPTGPRSRNYISTRNSSVAVIFSSPCTRMVHSPRCSRRRAFWPRWTDLPPSPSRREEKQMLNGTQTYRETMRLMNCTIQRSRSSVYEYECIMKRILSRLIRNSILRCSWPTVKVNDPHSGAVLTKGLDFDCL